MLLPRMFHRSTSPSTLPLMKRLIDLSPSLQAEFNARVERMAPHQMHLTLSPYDMQVVMTLALVGAVSVTEREEERAVLMDTLSDMIIMHPEDPGIRVHRIQSVVIAQVRACLALLKEHKACTCSACAMEYI